METLEFYKEVWEIASQIPAGKVLSYGEIARMMGRPQNSRMVGKAMWCAPPEMNIPCHRVVNSAGRIAPGCQEHYTLLRSEGVVFRRNGNVNMKLSAWRPELEE